MGDGRVYLGNADEIARPLRLSREEALSLIVALRAIEATGQLADDTVVAATLAKLEAATGSSAGLDTVGRRIHVHVAEEGESDRLLELQDALAARRRVRLEYHVPSRDELTRRDVDPMRLFAQDGHWYLEAYCHRAADVRLFRLDRIENAQVLDADGTPPQQARGRDLDAGVFQAGSADLVVEFELTPAARWVADYYPYESLTEHLDEAGKPTGSARLVLRVADPAWVRRLAWRLGGTARLTQPDWLAREVVAGARAAVSAY